MDETTLQIGDEEWTIKKVPRWRIRGDLGRCVYMTRTILIRNDLSPCLTMQTVLHEVFEAKLGTLGHDVVEDLEQAAARAVWWEIGSPCSCEET